MTDNNKKQKFLMQALRVVLAVTFILKNIYPAEGVYNGMEMPLSTWILVAVIIGYGLLLFAVFSVISSLIYNNISMSRFFPVKDGTCAVSRNSYLIKVYTAAIINNVIIGALYASLYAIPVFSALFINVISKLVAIISVTVFVIWLGKGITKKNGKEYAVAMAFPSFFLFVIMGV